MNKIIWCKNCVLPNTRPNITINSSGVCNACINHKNKDFIDWKKRSFLLKKLIKKIKQSSKSRFDCLLPVSGGKDSTWQVYNCLKFGLKPLTFTWKNPSMTSIGRKNLDNLINLGVDHIQWTINPIVESKFMLKTFKKFGSTAIPMHFSIHNIARNIAEKFDIPLIVWGENSALEYGENSKSDLSSHMSNNWRKHYGVNNNSTIFDWVGTDLTEDDLASYIFDFNKNSKVLEIFLGNFIRWDPVKIYAFSKKIGFKKNNKARTGIYKFADIDDDFISIHHWMKWYKFGINRDFDNLSIEIRNKRISRNKAIELIKKNKNFLPINDINKFCKYVDIDNKTFFKIAEKFRNKNIWKKIDKKLKIDNFIIENWKW
jgi:N-acetyl sugar amidotransferase